jgi:excisionase family DNA binding protein
VDMEVKTQESALALSARELAARMGLSLRHIRRSDSAGWIPRPIRIGRSVRWPVDEVQAWMTEGALEHGRQRTRARAGCHRQRAQC